MKMRSEDDVNEQTQELKTITRLQGEPSAGVTATPHQAQGLLGAALSVLTQVQSRANGLAVALPNPPNSWKKGSKGTAKQGTGIGDRS